MGRFFGVFWLLIWAPVLASGCDGVPATTPVAPAARSASPLVINAVVGDRSWDALRGAEPLGSSQERIQVHLEWAEGVLRDRGRPPEMTDRAYAHRAHLLDALAEYRAQGQFPQRRDVRDGFHPRFVDDEGRLCAVAHLIATSTSRDAALRLNTRHEYARVLEMRDPVVAQWAKAHGFTLRELAIIQPSYPPSSARDVLWGVGLGRATYATGISYKHNFYTSAYFSGLYDSEELKRCMERTKRLCVPAPIHPSDHGLQLQATLGWHVAGGRPAADVDLLYALPEPLKSDVLFPSTFAFNVGLGLGSSWGSDEVALAPTAVAGLEWNVAHWNLPPLSLVVEYRPHVVPTEQWRPEWLEAKPESTQQVITISARRGGPRVRPICNLDRWVVALKRSDIICACLFPTRRRFERIMGDVITRSTHRPTGPNWAPGGHEVRPYGPRHGRPPCRFAGS